MSDLYRRFGGGLGTLFLALVGAWLAGMVLAPNVMMIDYALRPNLPPSQLGGPNDVYSLDNILYLANEGVHRAIFFKTVWASALVAFITFLVCYPMAFWLAQNATVNQTAIVLLALTIPFWINEVLRTLAWYILLAFRGPLNAFLLSLGIIDEPVRWYGDGGVLAGMTYAYILFMLFPIYNAIESLDKSQIEAARDLGASTWRIHWRVVIPHAKAGIATGCVFTFMLAAGSYVAPALLGAPGSRWFTEIIYNWFFEGGDWNRGAAYALVLLVLCLAVVLITLRIARVSLTEVAK
ncbi:ABC transporter permease [Nitratireductor aquimarinus]|uniref:ABC transporter permease n=1 Tax=Nitratireductor aquimarinus TaxID=889300 RepID=A0ABU4APM4_9HYPH|nr:MULTISPECIES: ABC transporter permease [Alphaproteobacteria]MBY6024199.1 ABC transporter permease [Nitratireductor sp. DP7N14-4]MBN7758913.1 ABC transporter permease [Nitratireductor aquimarinus]MBN7760842.1 ABC transporter permease [Nitratireductor aquibiodomus]MBN7778371.1 ABC transporter permease [Nitratireductor pacificus]MBN7782693.1 ABC transporter permease [Nitratireductor pacificus]